MCVRRPVPPLAFPSENGLYMEGAKVILECLKNYRKLRVLDLTGKHI